MRNSFTRKAAMLLCWLGLQGGIVSAQCTIANSGVVTDETCPAFYDGFIDVTTTGANGAVTYLWNTGDMTQDLVAITSGTYIVTATDAMSCVAIDTFVVTDAHGITVSLGNDTTLCSIVNYLLVPNTVGATFFYWQNGDQTPTFIANAPGLYSLFVQNSYGCFDDDTLILSEYPHIDVAIASTQPGCGAATGALDLTAGGGLPPFQYQWSSGPTTEDINGLSIGTYSVSVTDGNQCRAVTNGIILPPTDLSNFTVDTNLICSADSHQFWSHTFGFLNDGLDDYLRLTDTSVVRPGTAYTLEAWIRPNSISGASQVIMEKRILSSEGVSLTYNPTSRTVSARVQNGPFFLSQTSTTTLQPGIWAHVALVVDGTFAKLYVNGTLDQNDIYTQGTGVVAGTPWTIGGGPSRPSFNGMIDEVRMWSIALTASQVDEFKLRPLPANYPELQFYFNFDQFPSGTLVRDQGAYSRAGAFVNANTSTAWASSNPMAFDFLWSFGDGSVSNAPAPIHNYPPSLLLTLPVWLQVTTQQGCSSTDSLPLPVHTPGNPNVLFSIPGPYCSGDTVYLHPPTPYVSYLWSTGSTNDSIRVNATGTYTLTADDGAGCIHVTDVTLNFAPGSAPRPVLTPVDSTEICEADTAVLSVGTGYLSYLWSNGSTNPILYATDSGAYSVMVTNGFGCFRYSDTTYVHVKPAPLATINQSNDTLYASPGVYYQWYRNQLPIFGSIQNYYHALVSGNYTVRVGVLAECDAISDPYSFLVGSEDPRDGLQIGVFPNPTQSNTKVRVDAERPGEWSWTLTDMAGRQLATAQLHLPQGTSEIVVPMDELATGAYFLRVAHRGKQAMRMVVKQ